MAGKTGQGHYFLSGEGLIDSIYHLFWAIDNVQNSKLKINVPETVIYRYGNPYYWYFTDKENIIRKKTTLNLTKANIKERFLKNASASGIVATYIYHTSNLNLISAISQQERKITTQDDNIGGKLVNEIERNKEYKGETIFEFLDAEGFIDFIDNRAKCYDGVLQKFIDPKGAYNKVIKIAWSPQLCMAEIRCNRRPLYEKKYDIYERALTYEGPGFYSNVYPVRSLLLHTLIQELSQNIATHITNVTFDRYRLARCVFYLKQDSNQTLWFLWSSVFKSADDIRAVHSKIDKLFIKNPSDYECVCNYETPYRVPPNIRNDFTVLTRKPINLQRTMVCPSCQLNSEPERMHELTFKLIIEDYEQSALVMDKNQLMIEQVPTNLIRHREAEINKKGLCVQKAGYESITERSQPRIRMRSKNFGIPPLLRRLYPLIKDDNYWEVRDDPIFLNKRAIVCEDCFLSLCSITLGSGINRSIVPLSPSTLGGWKHTYYKSKKRKQMVNTLKAREQRQHGLQIFPSFTPLMKQMDKLGCTTEYLTNRPKTTFSPGSRSSISSSKSSTPNLKFSNISHNRRPATHAGKSKSPPKVRQVGEKSTKILLEHVKLPEPGSDPNMRVLMDNYPNKRPESSLARSERTSTATGGDYSMSTERTRRTPSTPGISGYSRMAYLTGDGSARTSTPQLPTSNAISLREFTSIREDCESTDRRAGSSSKSNKVRIRDLLDLQHQLANNEEGTGGGYGEIREVVKTTMRRTQSVAGLLDSVKKLDRSRGNKINQLYQIYLRNNKS